MKKNLVLLSLTFLFGLFAHAQTLNIGTYNIRVDKEEDVAKGNGWTKRSSKICDLVLFHDLHLFGAQEVERHQLEDMLDQLKEYEYTGVAREDGNEGGEYVPIFYRPDMLQLIDSGNFWLSETPDTASKGFDAACFRLCTWGRFRMNDGTEFFCFNTHLDHRGETARREGAKLIISKMKEIAGDTPILLTGDFNAGDHTEVYRTFQESGLVTDSYDRALHKLAWVGTANNFDPDIMTKDRLDYIFISPSATVKRYGVLTDTYRDIVGERKLILPNFPEEIRFIESVLRLPSDHYCVKAVIEFRQPE